MRGLTSLALACAAHLVLVVVLRPRTGSQESGASEHEIDLTVIDSPSEPTEAPALENKGPATSAPSSASSSSKAKEIRTSAATRARGSEAIEAIEPSPSALNEGETWTFHPGAIDLGIGKPAQLSAADLKNAGRETEAPRAATAPVSTTGGLIEALDSQDVARGIVRGGPARTAAETATRDAAVMGSAVFGVTIDSALNVTVVLAGVTSGLGIGGGCSPENIGVPAVRIVSARIVDESRL
jgi:hypothetical protein